MRSATYGDPAHRIGALAALGTLLGVVLSGPLAVALVSATHPQPPWRDAELFSTNYHPIQLLPYAGGLVLVASLIVLVASIHASAPAALKPRTGSALVFSAVFAAFIFFNYVTQTTFVPVLARRYVEANGPLLAALSMSNPTSLAWGMEMWGWGFFGVASWLISGTFGASSVERGAFLTFIANGVSSLVGAFWTVAQPGWVMQPAGLIAFGAWNALLAAMAVLVLVAFRRRFHGASTDCKPNSAKAVAVVARRSSPSSRPA